MTTTSGHGHHGGWDDDGERLEREAEMSLGLLEGAAGWLAELAGDRAVRRVLDIGSGPGVASCVLAQTFPAAEVVAVDGSGPLLDRASERAARLGLDRRVRTDRRELPAGLDGLEPADVVWASRVVHHLGDQDEAVRRIGALVRPGGILAIAEGGLPVRSLPRDIGVGRPGLEARIDVAVEDWFSAMRAEQPGSVPTVEDWPALLAAAGTAPCGTRSFLVDRPAPLDPATLAVVVARWEGLRARMAERISADDLATLERLLDPRDEAGLHRRRDVFVLSATTVYAGRAGG